MRKRLRLVLIVICILTLIGIRVFSPEDMWICDGDTLMKHGNPSSDGSGFFCSGGVLLSIHHILPMKVTSEFEHNTLMSSKFTCDGDGLFPELTVSDIPETAKFLALIVDDPDAPAGTWDHLLLANIPVQGAVQTISQNDFATALFGQNSRGELARGGPCPPSGTHRYFFKVYALSEKLDLTSGFSKERLLELMGGRIVDQAELIGLYKRQ